MSSESRSRSRLFRVRAEGGEGAAVTNIELFFDLVFVFAITQLSHRLLEHLTLIGAVETLVLFLGVWWVWIYTSWSTNWLDPEHAHVRLMLIAMMLGGLALSSAIPAAFGRDGLLFAGAYVAMQIGRTLYLVWGWHGVKPNSQRNVIRITCYFILALPLWLWGALADPEMRLLIWGAALAIEYAGPILNFRTPGLGMSLSADWDISGSHMAERCALFIIIALGEAVLVTGATYAALPHDAATTTAFVVSFIGSATMWWIYFDIGAKRGSAMIEQAQNVGEVARIAYTYLHMPIVAGVIVTAVGDEVMLAHPAGHTDTVFVLTACGGPWLFLLGNQAFKWITSGAKYPPLSHIVGAVLLVATGVAGLTLHWSPLTIGMAATAALIVTALWEWFSLNGGWQRWAPWLAPSRLPNRLIAPDDTAR